MVNSNHRNRIFFFLLFLVSFELAAQDVLRINGLVSDASSDEVLEYAHIGIAGSTIGTVSNSLGVFSLIIPQRFSSQELSVSYIGYETFTIPIDSIGDGEQEIKLVPTAVSLAEIVISNDQRSIIEQAIEAIPNNYDLGVMQLEAFWRAQISNTDTVIQLSESAFEIYRYGKKKNKDMALKIDRGRISRDSAAFKKIFNLQAGIGPKSLFAVSFLVDHPLLSKKITKNHVYDIVDVTSYNGRNVYVIDFDRAPSFHQHGYQGQMLIEIESLAFVKIKYSLSYDEGDKPRLFEDSKFAGTILGISNSEINHVDSELNYHLYNGKWYLSHAKYDASFTIIHEKKELNERLDYYADFIITNIQKEGIVLPEKEELAKNRILERQFINGENFWRDYNYLAPDQDFDQMFKNIQLRNQSIEYLR